jgi:hypothetical protein
MTDKSGPHLKKVCETLLYTHTPPPPPTQFRGVGKAVPNFQFRGKFIPNNLISLRVSLSFKLSGTPWLGGFRPQIPVLSALCPQLNLLNLLPPRPKQNSWVRHWRHLDYMSVCLKRSRYTDIAQNVQYVDTGDLVADSSISLSSPSTSLFLVRLSQMTG